MFTYAVNSPGLYYRSDVKDKPWALDNAVAIEHWDASKVERIWSPVPPPFYDVGYDICSRTRKGEEPLVYTRDGTMCKTQRDACFAEGLEVIIMHPVFRVFRNCGQENADRHLPLFRDHVDVSPVYSIIMDIPAAIWQQSEDTEWVGRDGEIEEIYLVGYNLTVDPRSHSRHLAFHLIVSAASGKNATELSADFNFASEDM